MSHSWSSRFKIQESALLDFAKEAKAAGIDVLHWCLVNEKIAQEEYLGWAMTKFELPAVKADFFTSLPDLELWSKTKSSGPWSQSLVPLSEWDGCLYIGCLEPPKDGLRPGQPYRFVLSAAHHLNRFWEQLNNPQDSTLNASQAPQPEAAIELPTELEMPSDFGSSPEETTPDDEPTLVTAPPAAISAQQEEMSEETATLSLTPEKKKEEEEAPRPQAEVRAATDTASGSPKDLDTSHSRSELAANALEHILQTFEDAMVLTFERGILKPWVFSARLKSEKNDFLPTIETGKPSIFRIVLRTRLPYHGYVASSPTNDAFFKAYYKGTLPKHVTLVPIKIENQILGMLMGLSNKENESKSSLAQMERLAEDMARHIVRFKQSAAA